MFLLHGDSQYVDVLERAAYNSVVSGVSFDGKEFFYPNPLASRGDYARSKWFDCSCCPTNLCRFIPSVPGYAYAVCDDGPYINLFVEGSAELDVDGKKVRIEQKTSYPWDGRVEITVTPEIAGEKFALHVRVPGWSQDEVWPSDLYTYLAASQERPTLELNGEPITIETQKGYAVIERDWQPGDTLTLILPMPVRRVVANQKVVADRGRVALMRGPLVFCVEGADVDGGNVRDLVLPDAAPLASEYRGDLLGGVQVITGSGENRDDGKQPVPFVAIPYYAWAHRGKGQMAVWLPRTADVAIDGRSDDESDSGSEE
jgi:DUF1680 family protein